MRLREELSKLWARRDMIRNLVVRDLKIKYKGSTLGFIWSFLNPVILMTLYYLVFAKLGQDWRGKVMEEGGNYGFFLITGIWHWMLFSSSVSKSAPLFILNDGLIKKVYFPREILPIATVLSEFINFLFGLAVILIAAAVAGYLFNWYVLLLPVLILTLLMFTMGLSMLVSVWDVYFRDTEQILNSVLTIGFFATPIFYSVSLIREKVFGTYEGLTEAKIRLNQTLSKVYFSNPLATLIPYIRRSILGFGVDIEFIGVVVLFVVAFLFLLLSYMYFKRNEYRLVEEV